MTKQQNPTPTEIKLLQKSRLFSITFDDGAHFELPCKYLRVFSPSIEVRGYGQQEPELVVGKQDINIIGIDPVGNYAVKLIFSDGHSTGLFSWTYLYELGLKQEKNWQDYVQKINKLGE